MGCGAWCWGSASDGSDMARLDAEYCTGLIRDLGLVERVSGYLSGRVGRFFEDADRLSLFSTRWPTWAGTGTTKGAPSRPVSRDSLNR